MGLFDDSFGTAYLIIELLSFLFDFFLHCLIEINVVVCPMIDSNNDYTGYDICEDGI
jgi:hypothetical protein